METQKNNIYTTSSIKSFNKIPIDEMTIKLDSFNLIANITEECQEFTKYISGSLNENSQNENFNMNIKHIPNKKENIQEEFTKQSRVRFKPINQDTEIKENEDISNEYLISMFNSANNGKENKDDQKLCSSSKLTSFSFRDKSNQILKKIQKRNTFVTIPNGSSNKENIIAEQKRTAFEPKIFKSKSDYMNFSSFIKAENSVKNEEQKLIKIESMVDLTNEEVSKENNSSNNSICAFSTRNLFMPKSKTTPSVRTTTLKTSESFSSHQMKNEFKPHVFKQQNSQSQLFGDCIRIKTIVKPLAAANSIKTEHNLTSKSEANIEDLHFNSITSEKKSENLKSKSSYFIQNDFNDSNNQINDEKRPLNKIVEERELNMDGTEKNVGKISKTQIPSKYSSFTDLTKNKSLNNSK